MHVEPVYRVSRKGLPFHFHQESGSAGIMRPRETYCQEHNHFICVLKACLPQSFRQVSRFSCIARPELGGSSLWIASSAKVEFTSGVGDIRIASVRRQLLQKNLPDDSTGGDFTSQIAWQSDNEPLAGALEDHRQFHRLDSIWCEHDASIFFGAGCYSLE